MKVLLLFLIGCAASAGQIYIPNPIVPTTTTSKFEQIRPTTPPRDANKPTMLDRRCVQTPTHQKLLKQFKDTIKVKLSRHLSLKNQDGPLKTTTLIILLKNGKKRLFQNDDYDSDRDVCASELLEYYDFLDSLLIVDSEYEGTKYILLRLSDGKELALTGKPIFSADHRFAVVENRNFELIGGPIITIYGVDESSILKKEFEWKNQEGPSAPLRIRFPKNDFILIAWEYGSIEKRKNCFEYRGHRWQAASCPKAKNGKH